MNKLIVVFALFVLIAAAMAAPQEEKIGAEAKSGDLKADSSFYGGFYGGYPYGGYGGFYGGYGGYGYGYPYGGYGFYGR